MRLFETSKDGGPESTVWAHWFVEAKPLFSVVLLRFEDGSRDAYHSHAFHALSWVLSGSLEEQHHAGPLVQHRPHWRPVLTRRETIHKVTSRGRTWVLSLRGPWVDRWREVVNGDRVSLTHGREIVSD